MKKNDIREAIQQMSRTPQAYSVLATVSAVDVEEGTCDCVPMYEAPDLLDVQIFPRDEDGELKKGVLLIPKVGSVVCVSFINDSDTGFVSMYSEVDEVHINSDTYGGLVKIEDLVTKLNNLENKVNTIISTYNSHTHVTSCGAGAGSAAVTTAVVAGSLTPTQKIDLENTTVKHGNGQ